MIVERQYFFSQKIDLYQAKELEKKIWYLSDDLVCFSLIIENNFCIGIEYKILESQEDNFIKYLNYIINNDILKLKKINSDYIWKKDPLYPLWYDSIKKYLYENEIMNMIGEGQIVLKSPLVELFWFFDSLFKELSCSEFMSQQYQFPTLLGTETLKKAGYFDSFPNLWMSVFRMKNDFDAFSSAKNYLNLNQYDFNDKIKILKYSLPHTMCYYVYNMFSNKRISNQSITTVGKSFRFENKYCNEMGRLWDFSIRETVFLGEAKYVKTNVDNYRKKVCRIADFLGLSGLCEFANDPFFLSENNALRVNVQRMKHVKAELKINLDDNKQIAVASFNNHGTFLGKRFNIRLSCSEDYITTGCIGIGLERFLIGFLCHYGPNVENWPRIIQDNFMDLANAKKVFSQIIKE